MGKSEALQTALNNKLLGSHEHLKNGLFSPLPPVLLLASATEGAGARAAQAEGAGARAVQAGKRKREAIQRGSSVVGAGK